MNKLLHTKSEALFSTSYSDNDLANKFADFFTEKITNLRSSLDNDPIISVDSVSSLSKTSELSCFKNVSAEQVSSCYWLKTEVFSR